MTAYTVGLGEVPAVAESGPAPPLPDVPAGETNV